MKKLFYCIVLVVCCAFAACDTEEDIVELTPTEQELLEIDELIATQSPEDIDDEALIADLTTGFFEAKWYSLRDGEWFDSYDLLGFPIIMQLIFMEDGSVRYLFPKNGLAARGMYTYFCSLGFTGYYHEYSWNYDPETSTLYFSIDDESIYPCSKAVVRYYKDHHIILEGPCVDTRYDKVIISGNIDMDVDNRNKFYSEHDICYEEVIEGYQRYKEELANEAF